MLATPATRNTPEPRLTTDTWMGSQYDCSAGMTGAALVYSQRPDTVSRISTGSEHEHPQRAVLRPAQHDRGGDQPDRSRSG